MLPHEYEPGNRNASLSSAPLSDNNDSGILFGAYRPSNRQEILASIPSKSVVDKMVAGYFLDRPIVHSMCTRVYMSAKAKSSSCLAWSNVPN